MKPDRPADRSRVLFIGGPPGAGKTTTATAVAARLGWASTTGSDLTAAITTVTTASTHPRFHLSYGRTAQDYFTNSTVEDLISDATDQAEAMWPVVERVTRLHLLEKDPFVFDWWLLDPATVASYGDERIASVWLTIDIGALREREIAANEAFYAQSDDPDRMLDRFMARSAWRNAIAADAGEHGLPVIDVTNRTVDEVVENALDLTGLS